jgi:hypothetical protein
LQVGKWRKLQVFLELSQASAQRSAPPLKSRAEGISQRAVKKKGGGGDQRPLEVHEIATKARHIPPYGEPVAVEGHAVDAVDAALPRAGPVVSITRQRLRHREEVTLLENTEPILPYEEKFKYSYD